jgi:8-hydroxy-5-deazaflavin:NADPH oxidoreductase
MQIAIIGAGNVGKAIAGSSVRAGHKVVITSTSADKAAAAAAATGARHAQSNVEAVKGADLVILAVPAANADAALDSLKSALDGKIVVDVINRVDPKNPAKVLDGTSMSEHIQARVPKAHVVKAFNTAFAARQTNPIVDGFRIDGYVAGDNDGAKTKVLELVESIGFRPIDAGPLAMARALEAMALLLITLQIRHDWPWQQGWKLVGPPSDAA